MVFQVIKNYYSSTVIDEIQKEVNRLRLLEDISSNKIWKYYEHDNKNVLSRIEYFIKSSDKLKSFANSFFLNSNYVLFKDKINFKYPNGEGFIDHQDIAAGWGKYGSHHITIAIPLCDTTLENGCLYFADIGVDKMLTDEFSDLNSDIVPAEKYNPYPTQRGDIILFDSFIPHKSYKNNTQFERNILYFTYVLNDKNINDVSEKYHADKFKVVPPDIYKEKNIKYRSNHSFEPR